MRWTLPALVVVCLSLGLCSCGKKTEKSGDTPAGETVKPEVTALYQFWDSSVNEHVYSYGDGEPANWRKNSAFKNEKIIGYVATKQYPDAVPLYRAYCKDRRHYFYLKKPDGANDIERMEDFTVYVWTTGGDGRVPVHACFLPDDKDACFDQDLKRIKDYTDGTLKQIGKQRKIVENYFYVYPTGPAPSAKQPPVQPAGATAQPDWVVGMWMGQAGGKPVSLRYYPDGYFEESPTGSSSDAIHGTYTVQVANQKLEIRRDVGGTIVPEFQDQNSMTHPIGSERVALRKVNAPKTDVSPLKQQPLSAEAEALRKRLVGQWKYPAFAGKFNQVQILDYRADGTFTYSITPDGQPERKVSGRWVVSGQSKDPDTGKLNGLTLTRFVDGKMIAVVRMIFADDVRISHTLYGSDEHAIFVQK